MPIILPLRFRMLLGIRLVDVAEKERTLEGISNKTSHKSHSTRLASHTRAGPEPKAPCQGQQFMIDSGDDCDHSIFISGLQAKLVIVLHLLSLASEKQPEAKMENFLSESLQL